MNIAAYAIVFLLTLTRYKALTLSVRKDPIEDNFMLFSDNSSNIYQLNLKDQRIQEIKAKGNVVMYDPVQERVTWTSFEDYQLLKSMHLNGTGKKEFRASGDIEYLDVDYSTGNIYYTALDKDLNHYYISVLSPDGKHKDLYKGLGIPNGLVVYPSEGYIFYLENHALLRITMDGKQSENLLGYLDMRGGLTVDYKNGYLYWLEDSDPYRSDTTVVKYCKPDGTNYTTLTSIRLDVNGQNYIITEMAVYEDAFFISSYKPSRLMKLNKSKPNKVTELIVDGELGLIGVISIYSSKNQNKNAFCSDHNGSCSTFCLPVPGGGLCACEDGVDFKEGSTSVCSNMMDGL